MNEQFIMHPGDTFVAEDCGCSFTVVSGPDDDSMATEAPRCCCGHPMHKQGSRQPSGETAQSMANSDMSHGEEGMSTPPMMRD